MPTIAGRAAPVCYFFCVSKRAPRIVAASNSEIRPNSAKSGIALAVEGNES
jgi:hypothetical protein